MAATSDLPRTAFGKGLQALAWCLSHPRSTLRDLNRGLARVYRDAFAQRSAIPLVPLRELLHDDITVSLRDFVGRAGNVTLGELISIGALVRRRQPRVLVEIGTFDGNTTLQMAENSPADAVVHTLDLPPATALATTLDADDAFYAADPTKEQRRYAHSPLAHKITQWLGDSATFDFRTALAGLAPDFVFIDGSHAYDFVRNDTEKMLELLAPGALVLWHDFTPAWPGVVRYLTELSAQLGLRRIEGTSLVTWEAGSIRPSSVATLTQTSIR